MRPILEDRIGEHFGDRIILKRCKVRRDRAGGGQIKYLVRCKCGIEALLSIKSALNPHYKCQHNTKCEICKVITPSGLSWNTLTGKVYKDLCPACFMTMEPEPEVSYV